MRTVVLDLPGCHQIIQICPQCELEGWTILRDATLREIRALHGDRRGHECLQALALGDVDTGGVEMGIYYCTDGASWGEYVEVEAESAALALSEYISDALDSPSSYNQGEEGVSTRIEARADSPEDETDCEHGVIDFGAGVDLAAVREVLAAHPDGMAIDWRCDAGDILLDPPGSWGADTSDEDIARAVADASWDAPRTTRSHNIEEAVEYWEDARNSARCQRDLVGTINAYLDELEMGEGLNSYILARVRECVDELVEEEQRWGDASTYGILRAHLGGE